MADGPKNDIIQVFPIEEGPMPPFRKRGAPGYVAENAEYIKTAIAEKYSTAEEAAYQISRMEHPKNDSAAEALRSRLRYVLNPIFSE